MSAGVEDEQELARLNAALTAEGIVDRVLKSVAKAERFDAILAGKLLAELDKADPNPEVQKQIQRLASGAP